MQGQTSKSVVERLDDLEQELDEVKEENEQLKSENEDLRERVDNLERQNQILEDRCDALADGLDRLRERLDDGDLADDVERGADPDVPRKTPLEDVVALPEDVADRETSPNVQRARWLASNIKSAGKKTPVGYMVNAGEIGRLLDVSLDVHPHPQTVARILSIIDEMGDQDTSLRRRQGEKRIFVKEELANRLEAHAEMRQENG